MPPLDGRRIPGAPAAKRPRLAEGSPSDGFISLCQEQSEESSEECDRHEDATLAPPKPTRPAPGGRPLTVDLACSDLLLDLEETTSGACAGVAVSVAGELLKSGLPAKVWALGRGVRPAFQGVATWRLRVTRLPPQDDEPSILFGVLAQPPGCLPMPGSALAGLKAEQEDAPESQQQPALALLADTGEQYFTSNRSPCLLRAPLLPRTLKVGDVVEACADLSQRRLHFRLQGEGPKLEAKRLPAVATSAAASGRGTQGAFRLRETAYHAFFALRGDAAVELEDMSAASCCSNVRHAASAAEAIVLAGPPGAGKTAWATQHAASKLPQGMPVQVLGAEWLLHRANFTAVESEALRPVCAPHPQGAAGAVTEQPLGDEGRLALAERLLAAFCSEAVEALAGAAPSTEKEGAWTLPRARELLPSVIPELLRRSVPRGASVVADNCHLEASCRAALRAALLRHPGRVRWVVVLPSSLDELQRRRALAAGSGGDMALDERCGATLPGGTEQEGSSLDVEFAEGRDLAVFRSWLGSGDRHQAHGNELAESAKEADGAAACVQSFFLPFGDARGFISTEGMRRY